MDKPARRYLSIRELSLRLGISYDGLRQMRDSGDLPRPVQIGKRQLYPLSRLEAQFPELIVISSSETTTTTTN